MGDIGYDPGSHGLRVVDSLDEPGMSYEFHTLCVWQHTSGKLYWAEDSGCSCPTPFENYQNVGDLNHLGAAGFDAFVRAVEAFPVNLTEQHDLIKKVRELLEDDFTEWVLITRKEAGVSYE
jgi:hypothetical protein